MAADSRPVPLYTVPAIEWLDQHVMKEQTVLGVLPRSYQPAQALANRFRAFHHACSDGF